MLAVNIHCYEPFCTMLFESFRFVIQWYISNKYQSNSKSFRSSQTGRKSPKCLNFIRPKEKDVSQLCMFTHTRAVKRVCHFPTMKHKESSASKQKKLQRSCYQLFLGTGRKHGHRKKSSLASYGEKEEIKRCSIKLFKNSEGQTL